MKNKENVDYSSALKSAIKNVGVKKVKKELFDSNFRYHYEEYFLNLLEDKNFSSDLQESIQEEHDEANKGSDATASKNSFLNNKEACKKFIKSRFRPEASDKPELSFKLVSKFAQKDMANVACFKGEDVIISSFHDNENADLLNYMYLAFEEDHFLELKYNDVGEILPETEKFIKKLEKEAKSIILARL